MVKLFWGEPVDCGSDGDIPCRAESLMVMVLACRAVSVMVMVPACRAVSVSLRWGKSCRRAGEVAGAAGCEQSRGL